MYIHTYIALSNMEYYVRTKFEEIPLNSNITLNMF